MDQRIIIFFDLFFSNEQYDVFVLLAFDGGVGIKIARQQNWRQWSLAFDPFLFSMSENPYELACLISLLNQFTDLA